MNYRTLGASRVEVSEICLGSWLTYSGGIERDQAVACTRAAFDAGITFFDTANVYGRGSAEAAWGEILADYARDSYVLATKLALPMADDHHGGLSAHEIHKQVDQSLRRLSTDYIDLYYCHRADPDTAIEETMEALTELVRAGKVRALGFSEWTPEQILAGLAVSGAEKFIASQPLYNMLWRAPEDEVMPLCAEHGISQVVYSPLAQGLLTGKYRPGEPPPADSRAASDAMNFAIGGVLIEENLIACQRLQPIAEQAGLTMAEMAVAWVLRRSELAAAIVGASRPAQVVANAKASDITLSQTTLEAIDEALTGVMVTGQRLAPFGARDGVTHR
jgi:aryl-alcohol dehydrogenase-like predicted oxidoreductase